MGTSLITPTFQRQAAMRQLPPELARGFVDIDATLVFNFVLQPGQVAYGLQQPISGDGDFWLCGMQALSTLSQRFDINYLSGNVGIRIADDTGYKLASDFIPINLLSPMSGNSYPWVIRPSHLFRAGTRINIDLQELSNASQSGVPIPNIVQLAFRGRYRYKMSTIQEQQALIQRTQRFKRGER